MRALVAFAALGLAWPAAAADVVSERPEAAAVVIYRDPNGAKATEDPGQGLAMVIETRTLDLPAGRSTIRFRGVADTMVPHTAALEGLPVPVAERNFDYDLLTPGSLLANSVGQPVRIVRTLPATGAVQETTGIIRSAPEGVLIETAEGIEAHGCSGGHERLVFDRAPPNLADRPTLSMIADLPEAGRHTVRLSYLAVSFNWSADYVGRIQPDGRTMNLEGWLTLSNQTATSFPAAPTYVVAGRLERSGDTDVRAAQPVRLSPACWPRPTWAEMSVRLARFMPPPPLSIPMAPAPMMAKGALEEIMVTARRAAESDLGDLKLYSLPEPKAVSAQAIKQVAFLGAESVPFERVYIFRGDRVRDAETPPKGRLQLRLKNEKSSGLGVALPSGSVVLMQDSPSGEPLFIGEEKVEDTSVGNPVELTLQESDDVALEARVAESQARGRERTARTLTFRNTRDVPVTVEVRHSIHGYRLVKESRRHTNRASDLVWSLALAPHDRATFSYEVEAAD